MPENADTPAGNPPLPGPEADKVIALLGDLRRLSQEDPECWRRREFFEHWQQSVWPRPFALPPGPACLGEFALPLRDDAERVACLIWDNPEECPMSAKIAGVVFARRLGGVFEVLREGASRLWPSRRGDWAR